MSLKRKAEALTDLDTNAKVSTQRKNKSLDVSRHDTFLDELLREIVVPGTTKKPPSTILNAISDFWRTNFEKYSIKHGEATSFEMEDESDILKMLEDDTTNEEKRKAVALARKKIVWEGAEEEIRTQMQRLIGIALTHGRKESLHVYPTGSLNAPILSIGNYAPLRSNEQEYGTCAEPTNSCMNLIRHKLNAEPTRASMTKHTFYIENCFERLDTAIGRETGKHPSEILHTKELQVAHRECKNSLIANSSAKVLFIWGSYGAQVFKEDFPDHSGFALANCVISGSKTHVLIFFEDADKKTIKRMAFLVPHPESWLKHRSAVSTGNFRISTPFEVADLAYNFGYSMINARGLNPEFIYHFVFLADVKYRVPSDFDPTSLADYPFQCITHMKLYEIQHKYAYTKEEIPTGVVQAAIAAGWKEKNTKAGQFVRKMHTFLNPSLRPYGSINETDRQKETRGRGEFMTEAQKRKVFGGEGQTEAQYRAQLGSGFETEAQLEGRKRYGYGSEFMTEAQKRYTFGSGFETEAQKRIHFGSGFEPESIIEGTKKMLDAKAKNAWPARFERFENDKSTRHKGVLRSRLSNRLARGCTVEGIIDEIRAAGGSQEFIDFVNFHTIKPHRTVQKSGKNKRAKAAKEAKAAKDTDKEATGEEEEEEEEEEEATVEEGES